MPRQGQIVPEYLVPHVKTYINDNSIFTDTAASPNETGIRSLHVFASPKGEDGVLKVFDDYTKYLEEYGTPNYDLYGQAGYMPYVALRGGNARCWCMRVMPETATYANAMIVAKVKDTEVAGEDGELVKKGIEVKFVTKALAGLTDKDSMGALLIDETKADRDDEGFISYPIMLIAAKGRGAYGNSLRMRITPDVGSDGDNNFKNYIFEVLDNDGGIQKKETLYGCLSSNAIVGNVSLFVEDVFADYDNGSKKFEVVVSQTNLEAIYKMYTNVEGLSKYVSFDEFDFFGGLDKTNKNAAIEGYTVLLPSKDQETGEEKNADAAILSATEGGILLSAGDDSTFAADFATQTTTDELGNEVEISRESAMNDAYIKAFNGEFDSAILSKRRTPCELIMDAGYAAEVKAALVGLAMKRYDARCIIDAGIQNSVQQILNWANGTDITAYDDRIISKECQNYKVKDPFTGKIITVTTTYYIAANLPNHYTNYGNQTPFVGSRYAQLTGYVKNSLRPMIDADDLETKEALYTNRVNYFECIAEDTYIRGTQGTSQTFWSDLSEENNVAVMLDMKRQIEEYVSTKLYNFAEPEDRALFTEDVDRMFADYINTKVRSFSVVFDMNAFEEERSILHCYLSVVFRTMAKRGIIEIDINKRV